MFVPLFEILADTSSGGLGGDVMGRIRNNATAEAANRGTVDASAKTIE
jgi:hypothetical protein